MTPRIGFGYDVHRLAEDRRLIVCGVEIPHSRGLLGHSDADVGIHALIDALLGAAALGDIGALFPDTDMKYKDIDSRILLRKAVGRLSEAGYTIGNVDITIVAQAPRMRPYIDRMRETLAADMGVEIGAVSVKATTTERLGFTGREEGIAATAAALIWNSTKSR
ncbi:MAG: 2-C-methyl-D-erythritol 2,4-cyclodiphosphate synthase [Muribaculaceae bacterium]|nr:2-C-methyl-D-erythritol 2,4-cyclodiphosphate synthase [Muribaculaceae bacterium]